MPVIPIRHMTPADWKLVGEIWRELDGPLRIGYESIGIILVSVGDRGLLRGWWDGKTFVRFGDPARKELPKTYYTVSNARFYIPAARSQTGNDVQVGFWLAPTAGEYGLSRFASTTTGEWEIPPED